MKKCTNCDPKDEHIFPEDRSSTRISRPCSGCGKHQTIAGALLKSKEWKLWYEYASKNMLFDVDETATIDAMGDEHFAGFITFVKKQNHKTSQPRKKESVLTFYHATTKNNWKKIKKEKQLWGIRKVKGLKPSRCTYLALSKQDARYTIRSKTVIPEVILEIKYNPVWGKNNFVPDGWQFREYKPIPLFFIKKIK